MALHVETRAAGVAMALITSGRRNRRNRTRFSSVSTGSILAMTRVTSEQEEP
jgi:hypothetical protein